MSVITDSPQKERDLRILNREQSGATLYWIGDKLLMGSAVRSAELGQVSVMIGDELKIHSFKRLSVSAADVLIGLMWKIGDNDGCQLFADEMISNENLQVSAGAQSPCKYDRPGADQSWRVRHAFSVFIIGNEIYTEDDMPPNLDALMKMNVS